VTRARRNGRTALWLGLLALAVMLTSMVMLSGALNR